LKPEESDTWSVGFVYQPQWAEGLSVGIDYWNIEVEDVIGIGDINNLFPPCLDSPGLDAPACDLFDFGPYDFDINFIFPGDATLQFANLGTLETEGVDIDVLYSGELNATWADGYDLSWSATYVDKYDQGNQQTGVAELVGTADGFAVYPEWRMNVGAGIYGENWTVNYSGRYIGSADDLRRPCYLTDACEADSVFYSDIVGTYTWENITFALGARNITDEDPPRFHSAFNANTEPGMYDVVGSQWYGSFKVTF